MTTLTLAKLAAIEAAFDDQNSYLHHCDPATVAALVRIANIAVRWAHEPHELRNRSPATDDLLDALRASGLLE